MLNWFEKSVPALSSLINLKKIEVAVFQNLITGG